MLLGARVDDVAEDRLTMHYRVVSHRLARVAAEGDARVVAFDYGAGHEAALPDAVAAAIAELEGR